MEAGRFALDEASDCLDWIREGSEAGVVGVAFEAWFDGRGRREAASGPAADQTCISGRGWKFKISMQGLFGSDAASEPAARHCAG